MDPPDPEALVHLEMSYPTIKTPLTFETLRLISTPYVSGALSILSGGRRGNELQSSAPWVVGRSAAGPPQGQVGERIFVTSPVGGLEPPIGNGVELRRRTMLLRRAGNDQPAAALADYFVPHQLSRSS